MKYIIIYLFFVTNIFFAQESWKVDSSSVNFSISNAGITVSGTIEGLVADLKFSKDKLSQSSFVASVNPETIKTGIKLRDKHLKNSDYFNAESYPKITITSEKIVKSGNNYICLGNICIKEITKKIPIKFVFSEKGGRANFNGFFSINRLDFGLGEKSTVLSETVNVKVFLQATKK